MVLVEAGNTSLIAKDAPLLAAKPTLVVGTDPHFEFGVIDDNLKIFPGLNFQQVDFDIQEVVIAALLRQIIVVDFDPLLRLLVALAIDIEGLDQDAVGRDEHVRLDEEDVANNNIRRLHHLQSLLAHHIYVLAGW